MMDQSSFHVSTGDQSRVAARPQLQYFPISFFAATLGLTGTTIAFQRAERLLELPFAISNILLVVSLAVFLAIATLYALKAARYRDAVRREFDHPIKINFFPTISISLLLFSIAFLRLNSDVSRTFWVAGVVVHLLFTVTILSAWMQRSTLQIQHINPSWFIPMVGNIIVPITGVEHASVEISWFFFSIGLIFWLALFILFLHRMFFHNSLPERLAPTLFIMIAPPAIGFISYLRLMEHEMSGFELDGFARILYYFALFIFVVVLVQYRQFVRIPFYLSWWAYSFPMAAISIATVLMASKTGMPFFQGLAYVLLIVLAAVITLLLVRTIAAIVQRKICVEEE
ncbi:SLAC1 anion channel family protein [Roseiflexus sp.]|uniref:SLAC1 anion channel family protein n=1 Tax=Roseiflexus sp. TaxID=2562120 RepID=UPI00398BB430